MEYNRTLDSNISQLIEQNGSLRWLFHYVRDKRKDLDFLIGKTKDGETIYKQWISIYRGTSKILTIYPRSSNPQQITIDAADTYKKLCRHLYDIKSAAENFQTDIEKLLNSIANCEKLKRYYDNGKEGFFQNDFSRKYGLKGNPDDEFVIIDKEVIITYKNDDERKDIFGKAREEYKNLYKEISQKYPGKYSDKTGFGNELDFLALNRDGDIWLIECKHGTSTSGIYRSPLQIGLYYDLFTHRCLSRKAFEDAVYAMLEQKQHIGLINPQWNRPSAIRDIIPVLIISEYNAKSVAKTNYNKVLDYIREKKGPSFLANIKTYNYSLDKGLSPLELHDF